MSWGQLVRSVLFALAVALVAGGLILLADRAENRANLGLVTVHELNIASAKNCRRDLVFKHQYKRRGEVERRALRVQARVDRRLARVSRLLSHGPDRRTNRLLMGLAHSAGHGGKKQLDLLDHIHIIPLEGYCRGIARVAD